jgi:hypothetical protein
MSLTVLPKVAVHAELHKQLLHTPAAAATRAKSSLLDAVTESTVQGDLL